jgi:2-dehydro-3-deoxyphosphooctonate aldolase (KDO 8-P synthase)
MAVVHLKHWNFSIGTGQPLVVIAGLNVLENLDLALSVGRHLQAITADLGLPFMFKASFDKANRSSIKSYRGPGLKDGLAMLTEVKRGLNVPIATDIHEIDQAEPVAAVADLVQIPAFLCRQTDLVVAAARATSAAGGWLHVKKAQFLAPWDCKNIITKAREVAPDLDIILCERGSSFGYNNLVVDMLGIGEMQRLGVPVTRRRPALLASADEICAAGSGSSGLLAAFISRLSAIDGLSASPEAASHSACKWLSTRSGLQRSIDGGRTMPSTIAFG